MKLARASQLSNLTNQVCCVKHMQLTIKMRNEMNYLSHNMDLMFKCRGGGGGKKIPKKKKYKKKKKKKIDIL